MAIDIDAIDLEVAEVIETPIIDNDPFAGLSEHNRVKWQAQPIDATVLCPDNPLDKVLIDLIQTYRTHKDAQLQPTLNNRSGKVAILRRLNDSALINPEFKPDLVELIDYIDQLASAEQVSA